MRDALIANCDVKTHQKRCKTFALADTSNTVLILLTCAMRGIWFIPMNCLRWGRPTETGSQMKVCAIYSIQFTRMNCLWLGGTKETVSQKRSSEWTVCIEPREHKWFNLTKMCVIRGKQVCNKKFVRRPIITQTIAANKTCVLCDGIAYRTITYTHTHTYKYMLA